MAESLKENIEIGFNYKIIDDSFNITTSVKKKNYISSVSIRAAHPLVIINSIYNFRLSFSIFFFYNL